MRKRSTAIGAGVAAWMAFAAMAAAQMDTDIAGYRRGLKVPTAQEAEWFRTQCKEIVGVRPNALGLQRQSERRARSGLAPLGAGAAKPVAIGEEFVTDSSAAPAMAPEALAGSGTGVSDNSLLDAFPPIRSQGSQGSCAAFSTTYYQGTHNTALANGWNAKTGGDAFRLSPKWTYNQMNWGVDSGVYISDCLMVMRDHGSATWAEFPYTGSSGDYRAWCMSSNVWRDAVNRRANQYYTVASLYTDAGLLQLKQVLDNGYVAGFETYAPWTYKGWVRASVGNDPATTNDDALAGQPICEYVVSLDWGHAMTVVGYNDNVWCDINTNGVVDSGEKGALKIANSWGTGWGTGGFTWLAYDALKKTSAVASGPNPANRVYGFGYGGSAGGCLAYVMTARTNYTPKLIGRFTIRHALRDQVTVRIGKGTAPAMYPSTMWSGSALSQDGGAYAFDGTTVVTNGTFWLDMTDIAPPTGVTNRYFVGLADAVSDSYAAELTAFSIFDTATGCERTSAPGAMQPSSGIVNGATAWAWLDYACGSAISSSRLVVASAFGSATPAVGTNWYASGSAVTCRMANSPVVAGTTRYVCWGWTGSGSVVGGQGTSTVVSLSANSALTWQWKTQYWFSATAGAGGGVTAADGWYDRGASAAVTAAPDAGYHFVGWTGDTNGCAVSGTLLTAPMSGSRAVAAVFEVNLPMLTVASAHGSTDPAVGSHSYLPGTAVRVQVLNSPVSSGAGTQFVCTGWAGAGAAPVSGAGTDTTVFALTTDSLVQWQWKTQYWFSATAGAGGTVRAAEGWYDQATCVYVTAVPSDCYRLAGWMGDTNGCLDAGGQLEVPMTGSRTVSAVFEAVPQSLTVMSDYGQSIPPAGTYTYPAGTVVSAQVAEPVVSGGPGVRYVCSGWVGEGSAPAAGSGTDTAGFELRSDSAVAWQWQTQYWLSATAGAGGTVTVAGVWCDRGAAVVVTAVPAAGYTFAGWSGDLPDGTPSTADLHLVMDQPRAVTASFTPPAGTHYVDALSMNPVSPYLTRETAAQTIQAAIDAAAAGDLVLVADGSYSSGGRVVVGAMSNRVAITKALTVRSMNGATSTLIRGGAGVRCAYVANGASLSGFTLTGGRTRSSGDTQTDRSGAGAWCEADGIVSNCVIVGNVANSGGGGVYGGVTVGSRIVGNSAQSGAGVYGGTVRRSVLESNRAQRYGGGAVYSVLRSVLVIRNSAGWGGGSYEGTNESCTLAGNVATKSGGGAYAGVHEGCIVAGNSCSNGSNTYNAVLSYSCALPLPDGTGNIGVSPRFVADGDYRLQADSPCLDAGAVRSWMVGDLDVAGAPRVQGASVDIGAYEWQTPPGGNGGEVTIPPTAGDDDGDGMSNAAEAAAGTDPDDPDSVLRADCAAGAAGDELVVQWPSVAGRIYWVDRAEGQLGDFVEVAVVPGTPPLSEFRDPVADAPGPFFYRIRVSP